VKVSCYLSFFTQTMFQDGKVIHDILTICNSLAEIINICYDNYTRITPKQILRLYNLCYLFSSTFISVIGNLQTCLSTFRSSRRRRKEFWRTKITLKKDKYHIVFWFVCCQCEMVWLIDWLVFSVQRAIFQLYSGNSLVMFCITFVISCSGSHAKTSYYWQLISDAVIVGLLHIRAGGRYNPSNVSWSSFWSSVLL
jgi:hypothetical protein